MIFTLKHEHSDWITNDSKYNFGQINHSNLFVRVIKGTNSILGIFANGLLGHHHVIRHDISDISTRELFVALTWSGSVVKLYLNGQQAQELQVES